MKYENFIYIENINLIDILANSAGKIDFTRCGSSVTAINKYTRTGCTKCSSITAKGIISILPIVDITKANDFVVKYNNPDTIKIITHTQLEALAVTLEKEEETFREDQKIKKQKQDPTASLLLEIVKELKEIKVLLGNNT